MSLENPNSDREELIRVVLEYGNRLIESSIDLTSKISFEIKGERFVLIYTIYPRESGDVWVRVGLFNNHQGEDMQNTSAFNTGEVAMTRLMFNFESSNVHGEFGTDEKYEGRGFGSALLYSRDSIIKDIIKKYKDRFSSDILRSEIADNSRALSEDRRHEGLTTFLAEKMGYIKEGEKLVKNYNI